jgi:hypothetical protein
MSRLARTLAACALALAATSALGTARAADKSDPDSKFAVELRVGPYRPDVDADPSLHGTPFAQTFGSSTRWLLGAEVDRQFLHVRHVGSLGIGGFLGYTSATGHATLASGGLAGQASAEETTLWMMPLGAVLVARVDGLARETLIPLVFYGKIGLGTALWSASNASGTSHADVDGKLGRGHTNGAIFGAGVMFLVDAIDRRAAKGFSAEQGVNHSYVFAEWTVTKFTGLGQDHALYVGDATWNVGLAFEL